jgi:hypothetical protein
MFTAGRAAESLCWFAQLLDAAEAFRDPALQIRFYLGDLINAGQHADHMLALYAEEYHGRLIDVLSHDPKTVV